MSVVRLTGAAGGAGVAAGVPRQQPNAVIASARSRGRVMSPATTSSAPAGRSRRAANVVTSLRVIAFRETGVGARP